MHAAARRDVHIRSVFVHSNDDAFAVKATMPGHNTERVTIEYVRPPAAPYSFIFQCRNTYIYYHCAYAAVSDKNCLSVCLSVR
eukprot:COSAG02_NODE_9271_length_2271_cov_1.681860_2_plen_83_part_00